MFIYLLLAAGAVAAGLGEWVDNRRLFRLLKLEKRDRDENRDRQSLTRATTTPKESGP